MSTAKLDRVGLPQKKKKSKPKEMVWSVRRLSHKHEDLSSRPRTNIKTGMVVYTCKSGQHQEDRDRKTPGAHCPV